MLESEKEWRARVATKAPSPDSAKAEPTKEHPVPPRAEQPAEEADEDYADEYDAMYSGGMGPEAGSGLKTNMLLTADTLPPDVYGQPRRFVPTVPALRPDHVVSTVPNVQYAVVEGPARRRLRGMASNSLDLMPTPGSSAPQQFLVHPGMLDFGAVPEGGTYRMTINITNISVEMARFRVRPVPNALIKLNYKPGPVMAGMSAKIEVVSLVLRFQFLSRSQRPFFEPGALPFLSPHSVRGCPCVQHRSWLPASLVSSMTWWRLHPRPRFFHCRCSPKLATAGTTILYPLSAPQTRARSQPLYVQKSRRRVLRWPSPPRCEQTRLWPACSACMMSYRVRYTCCAFCCRMIWWKVRVWSVHPSRTRWSGSRRTSTR